MASVNTLVDNTYICAGTLRPAYSSHLLAWHRGRPKYYLALSQWWYNYAQKVVVYMMRRCLCLLLSKVAELAPLMYSMMLRVLATR
jgi:hypothetical protein